MKPERINQVIAEYCGFKQEDCPQPVKRWIDPKSGEFSWRTPDFYHDLNAMHEAEMVLRGTNYQQDNDPVFHRQWHHYQFLLMETYGASATASQRAEAFLKTVGKWEEDE